MHELKGKSVLQLALCYNTRLDFHYDNCSESTINSVTLVQLRIWNFLIASARTAKGERETALVKAPLFPLPLEQSRFSCSPPFQSTRARNSDRHPARREIFAQYFRMKGTRKMKKVKIFLSITINLIIIGLP